LTMKHIWRVITFTSELKKYYIAISIFSVLVAAMTQLTPLLTKAAIDEITEGINGTEISLTFIAVLVVLIFAADIAQTLFSNISQYLGDITAARIRRLLSSRYYEHIMNLPQRYFDSELTGAIINRMNRGIQQITDFMQIFSNNLLQLVFSTVFTLIIVAYYSLPVAFLLLTLYPIIIWLTVRTSPKWQAYQTKINKDLDVASSRFAESVSQIKVVKGFGQEQRELRYFDRFMSRAQNTTKPQSIHWHKNDALRRSALAVINLLLYGYIFIGTAQGTYTIGTMVLLIQYAQLLRIPLFSVSYLIDRTQRAISDSKDYFKVMDEQVEHVSTDQIKQKLAVQQGKIDFRDVSFSYDNDKTVLRKLNLSIEPDSKVALVGESGEGKTTLTNLLLRLYEPDSGTISIDGQDIQDVSQVSLRGNIGIVFQDAALFSGTVKENIGYARNKVSQQTIIAAAKAANAHDFINKLPKGYDTEIGERGLKLSGGQKQRIAIARALLKNAPILILDEATSSLDSKSEALVQDALEKLMKGRTTIIIAHRLSTIEHVDKIVTLKNGMIDEIGSPSELSRTNGIYAQLLMLQKRKLSDSVKKKLEKYEIAT
jgi:ATP-binding cassette, subfamily B, bacterial